MNILPKKRWHVRTKENIARVRRDEAQAAEEEKERERKIKLAEKEARRDFMRERARATHGIQDTEEHRDDQTSTEADHKLEHVNFFAEEEAGLVSSTAVNKEHEEEKKQETEKYEKQIGYLTYLGQDTNEATGKVSWYNKNPGREEPGLSSNEEMGLKHKVLADPLHSFKKYCSSTFKKTSFLPSSSKPSASESVTKTSLKRSRERSRSPEERKKDKSYRHKKKKSKKCKKEKKHKYRVPDKDSESSNSDDGTESVCDEDDAERKAKLLKLRAERLRREREEKKKAEKIIAKVNGVAYVDEDEKPQPKPVMKQRYNSQFNPDIAKQNYEDQRYRF